MFSSERRDAERQVRASAEKAAAEGVHDDNEETTEKVHHNVNQIIQLDGIHGSDDEPAREFLEFELKVKKAKTMMSLKILK